MNFRQKSCIKLAISDLNLQENTGDWVEKFGSRTRLQVLTGYRWFRVEPDNFGQQICSPEYCFHEISRIARRLLFLCRIV